MIGVFDSGSGGLSVLRAIYDILPSTNSIYLGDIKNAPYGEKSQEELSALTVQSIRFLQSHNIKNIVSACNSVSASLAMSLSEISDYPNNRIIEMVGPTISDFKDSDEHLLLCATPATVSSGIYQSGFRMLGKEISAIALPDLAGAIEFGASEKEIEQIIVSAFTDVPTETFDTLVLGCTHYPLVTNIFARVLGNSVCIVDPAGAVASRVSEQFLPAENEKGMIHFFITKESTQFRAMVATLFPESANAIEVLK